MLLPTMENVDIVELYEHTLDDLYRYASRLTGGDRMRTDELVQETYLTVLRRLGSDRPPADITISYLTVTCRSRFIDQLRSERRRRRREERATRSEIQADPIDVTDVRADEAVAALATLSDDQLAALVLRYVDDLCVEAVAVQLGRSVRATESLLVRARRALRAAFHERTNP